MKRVISLLSVLLLCVSLVCPAFAANDTFVPSISEKDHPEVVPTEDGHIAVIVDKDGNVIAKLGEDCIVLTPVSEAEKSEKIPEDAKQALLDTYQQLTNGTMEIPYGDDTEMVIRDLFDISILCEDDAKKLSEEGNTLVITLDVGYGAGSGGVIMVYDDGQWYPAQTKDNGDGTVTVILDRVGVLSISVPANEAPDTGDDTNVTLWIVLMSAAAVALIAVVIFRRKAVR